MKRILIIGSGGREHALGWAIRRDLPEAQIFFLPGNGGTSALGRNLGAGGGAPRDLLASAREIAPDLTVVGPEAPLVLGVVDLFQEAGLPIFGPTRSAAAIEGSKVFSKRLLRACAVPTAPFEVFDSGEAARRFLRRAAFPQVIKVDGLAQGKGVYVVKTEEEADSAIGEIADERRFGGAGDQILVEQFLDGEEVSAFALCRGEEFRLLPLCRDYKRIGDGDTGPNTGGMGALAPHPRQDERLRQEIARTVFAPILSGLAREGRPFHGLLFAGLMLVDCVPQVLEFNCRFGDPETQALLPLLGPGLAEALLAVATGRGALPEIQPWIDAGRAATVVLASAGYPGPYETGRAITGLEAAEALPETFVFHAGTRRDGGCVRTAGGRVLAVTGRGEDGETALSRAYAGAARIDFEGKALRGDIGRGIRP